MISDVLKFFLDPIRDCLYLNWSKKRKRRKEICQNVLERFRKEKSNFEKIITNPKYRSEDHRKAVEEKSFELLGNEINQLVNIKKFRRVAEEVLTEIKNKNAESLLAIFRNLEPKFKKYCE